MVTFAASAESSARSPARHAGPASLLRMGLGGRLLIAGVAVAVLWSAIAFGLS